MGLSIGRIATLVGTAIYGFYTGNWGYFITASSSAHQARVAERNRKRAINDYNSRLQPRLEMVDLPADQPRSLVLGRVRTVDSIQKRWSSGANEEKLTLIVCFAGHEIDGFEQFYAFDQALTLDGNGWCLDAPYNKSEPIYINELLMLDGSGAGVITLPEAPNPSTVVAVSWQGDGENRGEAVCTIVSIVGATVTVADGIPGAGCMVSAVSAGTVGQNLRIRPYLGTAAQNIGSALAAEYPGKITATDKFTGVAAAAVDMIYSTDIFPQGRATITAVLRGAKVYDPRLDSTVPGGSGAHRIADPATWAFSENPALHAYHYARHEFGWNLAPDECMPPEDVAAEANFCDTSTVFTLRKPDGSTSTVTLPRYRCGIVIPLDADPNTRRQKMSEILASMAGSDGWDGGVWRFRAGRAKTPVMTLDQTWLANKVSRGGKAGTEPVLRGANAYQREQRVNYITGSCVDPAQRYQALPYPHYEDAVLIAAKGRRSQELSFEGVNHVAHAQHLASVAIREAQAGTRIEALCKLRAYKAQLLDVLSIRLPRQGMDDALDKRMEVVSRTWLGDGGIRLTLAEVADALYTPVSELKGRDPAPDSSLRAPWDVEQIMGLSVTSGTAALTDGSILNRMLVSWDPVTGQNIRQGGAVEVQYIRATDNAPDGEWPSWEEQGSSVQAIIPGVIGNAFYRVRARAVQKMPFVRGPWSDPVLYQIAARRATKTFVQDVTPTGDVITGDLWRNITPPVRLKRWDGDSWEPFSPDAIYGESISGIPPAVPQIDFKKSSIAPANATAGFTLFADGSGQFINGTSIRPFRWHLGTSPAVTYYALLTVRSGPAPSFGAAGTAVALSSDQTWNWTQSGAGSLSVAGDFLILDGSGASATVIGSGAFTGTCAVSNPI